MSRLVSRLVFCAVVLGAVADAAEDTPPVDIGSRLELLVDDALIDKLDGLAFKLHSPHAAEVALEFDKPWEGSGNHYITVFRDKDGYHMYYHSVTGRSNAASGKGWTSYTCYATSRDGMKWVRPNLGLYDFQGSKNNNIVFPGPFGFEDGALLFPYPNRRPGAPPEQRYLAPGARVQRTGDSEIIRLFLFASPDRVNWHQVGKTAIINGLGTKKPSTFYPPANLLDSDHSLFWDTRSNRYILFMRDQRVLAGTGERLRAVRRATSTDLLSWSYPEWTHMKPSPPDQFYTFGARPYFRAPHMYLAFPMRYVRWRNARLPAKYKKQLGVGVSDTVFVSSRDGLHWDRRFLEAFIRPGLDPLKWTDRSNHTSMGLVPTGTNEMSVYTLEYFRLPVPRVRRQVMRVDGVASINAPYAGGQMTTRPLMFRGNRLVINASTSASGGIRVEMLNPDGTAIDRFSGDNAIEFFGDSIEQQVRWDQGPDVGSLEGKPVRLRFLMKDADLYSFRFSKSAPSAARPETSRQSPPAPRPIVTRPNVQTDRLGGVNIPSAAVLKKMHTSQYILHARDGRLERMPVKRVRLPRDGSANPQTIQLIGTRNGTVYANLASLICKSTDGGGTWQAHPKGGPVHGSMEVLRDGTFVLVRTEGKHPDVYPIVLISKDEGRRWQKIARIEIPDGHWGSVMWTTRLANDHLLAGIGHVNHVFDEVNGRTVLKSGSGTQWTYRSTDGGRRWIRLGLIHDWVSEGGVAVTESGKLFAALRYQRATMPGDPANLEERNNTVTPGWPWKHVFLSDSVDGGRTWTKIRQLATVYGQTRGYPVALDNRTVVVIHDTRYGPGSPGSRAMISRDDGRTWQNEVYYLDFTTFSGSYNASVRMDDGTILTVAGSSQAGKTWEAVRKNTDFYAIRWKPRGG